MRSALYLFFARRWSFWKARFAIRHLAVYAHRRVLRSRQFVRDSSTTTTSLWTVLKLNRFTLFLTTGFATVLQSVNPDAPLWLSDIGVAVPTESEYGTLLAAIIGGGAVFIGLYYAAINTIGGAIYATVPNNIRELLAQEHIGSAYMRFLALFTYFNVCLLAFHTAGLRAVIWAIPIILLGAGLAILGFVQLGTRAFNLFDPTTLSRSLFEQLRRCYMQVQAGSHLWLDRSFQNYTHTLARNTLDTLSALADITGNGKHLNGRPFAVLCNFLLFFLRQYETAKRSIPTNSGWYQQRYVHPDWYRSDVTMTSIAHDTGTGLQPEAVSDPRWVESEIMPIVRQCLELNLKERRYPIIRNLLDDIESYLRKLAEEGKVTLAFQLADDVFSWCEPFVFIEQGTIGDQDSLDHMEVCSRLAGLPIGIVITYSQAVKLSGRQSISQRIGRIAWKSERSIYQAGFCEHALTQLEWLRPRIEFEERAEGRLISPIWYVNELLTKAEAENHSAAMTSLVNDALNLFEPRINSAVTTRHPWLAAVIVSREWEYWHKLDAHMEAFVRLWENLNADRRLKGLSWPTNDTPDLLKKEAQRKKDLLKLMSDLSIVQSLVARPESHPDFAGQFLHSVGEAILSALCQNDFETVDLFFWSYFYVSLLQFENLGKQQTDFAQMAQYNAVVAVAPILDLMDLSGYAFLFADFHDTTQLKGSVLATWNDYLDRNPDRMLQIIPAAIRLTESTLMEGPRGIHRHGWRQTVHRYLNSLERRQVFAEDGFGFSEHVVHESALVRVVGEDDRGLFYDGIDIFITNYIRQRNNGTDLDLGRRTHRDLEEDIERETQRHRIRIAEEREN